MLGFRKKIIFKAIFRRRFSAEEKSLKILFFGNDQFSLTSLQSLVTNRANLKIETLEVVTTTALIRDYCQSQNDKIDSSTLKWPVLPSEREKLEKFNVGVVVSFGHLIPTWLIDQFETKEKLRHGLLNVHGSLLPRWRGATPIVYTLAHGDTVTGVTVMRIKPDKFDIGDILLQRRIAVGATETWPELYGRLATLGGACLVETMRHLSEFNRNRHKQLDSLATYAPKLTEDFSRVTWHRQTALQVYNLYRSLVSLRPLDTIWPTIKKKKRKIKKEEELDNNHEEEKMLLKLYDVTVIDFNNENVPEFMQPKKPGFITYDKSLRKLYVECADVTWVQVGHLGLPSKRKMSAHDFYNGFLTKISKDFWYFI